MSRIIIVGGENEKWYFLGFPHTVSLQDFITYNIDFDDENTSTNENFEAQNVHIYFSLMTLVSEQTLSTEGNRTEFKRCE